MKFLILALFAVAVYGQENYDGPEWAPFDGSQIIPRTDFPGFWEGRDFPRTYWDISLNPRGQRIVGGVEVAPNSHPYQVALHMTVGGGTGLCGGSVLTTRSVLTAGE